VSSARASRAARAWPWLLASISCPACGRELYDATVDAAESGVDAGPEVDASRPGADVGGAPACDWRAPFGPFEIVYTPASRAAFVSSPSLSPDGLTLRFLVDGSLLEVARPSLDGAFGAASASTLFTDLEPVASYFLRDDDLERFVARGEPADLFVQRRARVSDPWSPLAPLDAAEPINTAANEWDPFLSLDGLTLWLQRESMVEIRLFRTRRASLGSPFGSLEAIDVSAAGANPGSPSLPADGRAVVFANADEIWFAPIDASGGVGPPSVLVPDPDRVFEFEPLVRPDGCELFWVREDAVSGLLLVHARRAP
jgi:hypothetical protein